MKNVIWAAGLLVLGSAACVFRGEHFTVVPGDPSYLLRTPDREQVRFSDILRQYNGYQAGRDWIDLRPLMELRIENAYYKEGASRRGLAGYLGTEVARYSIEAGGLQLRSVKSMTDRPARDKPVQELIPSSAMKWSYYRFYYEILFSHRSNTRGSVLLGAASKAELEELSNQMQNPESVCYPGGTHCVVFPEACSVSVEMQIVVNGKTQSAVWGDLLRTVVTGQPEHLRVERLREGKPVPVRMDVSDAKALTLPLLPGDRVRF